MKLDLVSEQKEIYNQLQLIKEEAKIYRRKNLILFGKLGSGKTTLLQQLGSKEGFKYINFTKDYLTDFYENEYVSFLYLDSNDFLNYVSEQFTLSPGFWLIDSLEPILISLYQSGGKKRLITFFKNLFIHKPRGYLLLSIPKLETIDLEAIIRESEFREKNIFYLSDDTLVSKLTEHYQLPQIKVDEFENNHYFKTYQGGKIDYED
ncbi:MAG: hypothetical protein ACQEQI_06045 [Bacillota bacterium]